MRDWCASVVGTCELESGEGRSHGRTAVYRLRSASGTVYAKVYRERHAWETETHGYARWAPAFGRHAPRLLAVREKEPLAILVSAIPGRAMESARLPVPVERDAWRDAGRALARLHDAGAAERFGACARDGSYLDGSASDAVTYVLNEFDAWTERGERAGCLDGEALAVTRAARETASVFAGERPVPCHRDYCPANWLVDDDGVWAGVLDFEFSRWDVRAADFSRYPGWEPMRRPDLMDALFEGYGRPLTPREETQRRVARALYALGAIVWGCEHGFYDYADEGRAALRHLGTELS
jgi:Ser/Thr protein kinase RdoA (MazF antagonist)